MLKNYDDCLWAETNPYLQWLKEHNEEVYSQCLDLDASDCDFVIFILDSGYLSSTAINEFKTFFDNNKQCDIVYADEDYLDERGVRCNPWFKPEYSPDTLESFFYFGNIFAVRKEKITERILESDNLKNNIYYISHNDCQLIEDISVYEYIKNEVTKGAKASHISKVLFTNSYLNDDEKRFEYASNRKFNAEDKCNNDKKSLYETTEKISVIIPSKDNLKMLKACIDSFVKYVDLSNIEFIIVDNGSCDEQKLCITDYFSEQTGKNPVLKLQYIYEPMEFNFSRMCNLGAGKATGKYLLFLNDDIEIINSDWLNNMMHHAVKSHVGAVGAKLLYPNQSDTLKSEQVEGNEKTTNHDNCDNQDNMQSAKNCIPETVQPHRIQHVGITNMGIGPAHKLCGMEDKGSLYHGHNIYDYNMIAVTAACLLIRKEVFDKVNGFDETLAVAYNDVEICFRVLKAGYYNVQCNKAILIHHESVSRGQDDSGQKKARLARELATLYEKHPDLYAKDPFYSENLVQWRKDVDYGVNLIFPYESAVEADECVKSLPREHKNKYVRKLTGENRLMLSIDSVEYELYEKQLVIKGWFVVRGKDNAELTKQLVIKDIDTGKVYMTELKSAYRPDVEGLFKGTNDGTSRVAMSGIHVVIDLKDTHEKDSDEKSPDKKNIDNKKVTIMSENKIKNHSLQIGVMANKKIIWEETLWNQMK